MGLLEDNERLRIQLKVAQARVKSLEDRFGITQQLSDDHVMAMHRDAEMSAARDASDEQLSVCG